MDMTICLGFGVLALALKVLALRPKFFDFGLGLSLESSGLGLEGPGLANIPANFTRILYKLILRIDQICDDEKRATINTK